MTTRRLFIADLVRFSALCAGVPNVWRVTTRPRLVDEPFQLGVASGDPLPTGGILWTRLAPRPLESDGGMDGQRTAVDWIVAEDDGLTRVVQRSAVDLRATCSPYTNIPFLTSREGASRRMGARRSSARQRPTAG